MKVPAPRPPGIAFCAANRDAVFGKLQPGKRVDAASVCNALSGRAPVDEPFILTALILFQMNNNALKTAVKRIVRMPLGKRLTQQQKPIRPFRFDRLFCKSDKIDIAPSEAEVVQHNAAI